MQMALSVLAVDDDPRITKIMGRLLRQDGHKVTIAGGLAEALHALRSDEQYNLVVSDMKMGDGTGVDLHRWVLENRPDLAPKMVFFTGGYPASLRGYIEASGVEVVTKPDTDRLWDLINGWVL